MKKIILIVLIIFGVAIQNKAFAQLDDYNYNDSTFNRFSIIGKISAVQGFEIFSKDNANATIALPLGFDLRIYSKNNPYFFWEISLEHMPIIVMEKNFTSFFKFGLGLGRVSYFQTSSLGLDYYRNFLGFGNMYGFNFSSSFGNIPIILQYIHNTEYKANYTLFGLKLPIDVY